MISLDRLLAQCEALNSSVIDSPQMQGQVQSLRSGILALHEQVQTLTQQNQKLVERKASLELQMMHLASQPENSSNWWENVIIITDEGGDEADNLLFDPSGDTAA